MSAKSISFFLVSIGLLILTACNLVSGNDKGNSSNANMPNPAAVFCEENGGVSEIRNADDGSQFGICVFPDGSECDEWAFYRGECKAGDSLNTSANMPNPAAVFCEENGGVSEIRTAEDGSQSGACVFPDGSECDEWAYFRGECQISEPQSSNLSKSDSIVEKADDGCNIYHNSNLGYSFHFPADASIVEDDNPLHSYTILGSLDNDEHWPVIFIAHPNDREDYHPSEDADLLTWLKDHYLLGSDPLEEMQIGGTEAIHTRFDSNSGQSYNFDHYYFVHQSQLYSIVILHSGWKEDWQLYNHFLESFTFEG